MPHGSLYTELMNARTERQVAALVERYLRQVAEAHPGGFELPGAAGGALTPLLSAASRVDTGADIELLHATVMGYVETARAQGALPPGLTEVAEILAAARTRLKQLRRPPPAP